MTRRSLLLIALIGACATLVPWLLLLIWNHGALHVPPDVTDDAVYYWARMENVVHGFPFIGNPYFKEHAGGPAIAFFGADWVAAVPLTLGLSLMSTIYLEAALAGAVFAFLVAWLLYELGLRKRSLWLGIVIAFIPAFWLLERPVAMQVVFPAFLLFLIAYLLWLRKPERWKRSVFLVLTAALSFYLYTYLWQIVAVAGLLTHVVFLRNDRKRFRSLWLIDVGIIILALPMFWYTYFEISQPFYWESVVRIGLVETHTIGGAALTIIASLAILASALWLRLRKETDSREKLFFGITILALLITSISNVVSGKDLETAVHIARFVELFLALALGYLLASLEPNASWKTLLTIGLVLIVGWYALNALRDAENITPAILSNNAYAAPMQWLSANTPVGSVIMADDNFSYYLPMMTRDYTLFQTAGGLYLLSDEEMENRYLALHLLSGESLQQIENDYRAYAGVGNAVHASNTFNRRVEFCELFSSQCPPLSTPISYRGVGYFESLYARYQTMNKDPDAELRQFGVSYIVVDTHEDVNWNIARLPDAHLTANLGRFQIYALTQ